MTTRGRWKRLANSTRDRRPRGPTSVASTVVSLAVPRRFRAMRRRTSSGWRRRTPESLRVRWQARRIFSLNLPLWAEGTVDRGMPSVEEEATAGTVEPGGNGRWAALNIILLIPPT